MSAMSDTATDWQAEAVRLRRDQQMPTNEIAEMFGKSASQVRKVIASANAERHVNGTGPYVPEPEAERQHPAQSEPQGDLERAVEKPEDPLHAFKAEAGEAVGEMPKPPEPEMEGYEVRVKGTRQMALDFGPEADTPLGATIVLKSPKMPSGFYGGGDVITGTFVARVTDVPYKEAFDKDSEEFRAKPTAYVATITEFTVD